MQITINGQKTTVKNNINILALLQHLDAEHSISLAGAVVLVNETLIPKTEWKDHILEASAKIEILSFVSGG